MDRQLWPSITQDALEQKNVLPPPTGFLCNWRNSLSTYPHPSPAGRLDLLYWASWLCHETFPATLLFLGIEADGSVSRESPAEDARGPAKRPAAC
ncbi:Mitochondrial Rho Gtpase 1 [Manis pentadactyla]|nr:Mitochondrial Rho Gtpase 1 [Manis pentadactyla]